ncbi:TGF-beta receptor type-1-like [Hydractinia symbiolongicarpus]|uniref:TGF-beta receptor type-1-like n=1 Tax=Hydractinia symbiolongicarpus TaxID=13093 RepID=UPI00254F521B|nr:TGF-beta receptor type-1-like [Hydractinia symbiolongicarpus]
MLFLTLQCFYVLWNLVAGASNLTCYCNNKNGSGQSHRRCTNNKCFLKEDGFCYIMRKNGKSGTTFTEKGCLSFVDNGLNKNKDNYMSCDNEMMCNMNLVLNNSFPSSRNVTETNLPTTLKSTKHFTTFHITLLVVLPFMIGVSMMIAWLVCKYRKKGRNAGVDRSLLLHTVPASEERFRKNEIDIDKLDLLEFSSTGSGMGLPVLVQKTIAGEINLTRRIGQGAFGFVYHGLWRGQDVAVKVFSSTEESSWSREVKIYHTPMLRHENVLGFIAADSKDTGTVTQQWIITDYHSNGSLFDFLQDNTLDITMLHKMLLSIVNGVLHLHTEIIGTFGKPAMAHRDIKTKNILVKQNFTCCIADLGLTVMYSSDKKHTDKPEGTKTGTRRYQAPELLNNTLDQLGFQVCRRADIYALGLCLWEICRRTKIDGKVEEYQLPYFDAVQPDPSSEEMIQVVCVEKRRPHFSEHWKKHESMRILMKTMTECWYHEGSARLTALRIMKDLSSHLVVEKS